MIKLTREGTYKLIETKGQTKILTLDQKETFAWIWAEDIGEILIFSYRPHEIDHVLARGNYRYYEVSDEQKLHDSPHLELYVGEGQWQGYLVLTGFPKDKKKRVRIIPTEEIITKTSV